MIELLLSPTREALMITGFVFVMMVVIEYLNVLTKGNWQCLLAKSQWGQLGVGSLLGAVPGCLGAFTVVALYMHRIVGFGGLTATMIATMGDETFLLLALAPKSALVLIASLLIIGFGVGAVIGIFFGPGEDKRPPDCQGFELHEAERRTVLPSGETVKDWKRLSPARGIMATVLVLALAGIMVGALGPSEWDWVRVTLLIVTFVGLFIVATVSEHFLEEHLWRHVALQHIPRIFLWTWGAMIAVYILVDRFHLEGWLSANPLAVLLMACLVGIIPGSGPHMVFVTLFAKGALPFSVLLANSVVQDGHGMLPLLAYSRKDFVRVKAVNIVVGLGAGIVGYLVGF